VLPFADPALPLDEAGKYVAGAYVVFLVLIVVYVAIMAAKLQRIEKELRELAGFAESRAAGEQDGANPDADQAAPGRESETPSIPDSLASHGSGGGGA
jgi:type II secretory pathway component PulM